MVNNICNHMGMRDSRLTGSERLRHRGSEPHLLREIVRTHQVLMAGFSRKVGMPASRFALMRLVANAEEDIGVMDLARQLGINVAAVTRQVNAMEREGLIRRRADPNDGRRSHLELTPKGVRTFEQIHDRTHLLENELSRVIGVDEMTQAAQVLVKLRSIVEDLLKGDLETKGSAQPNSESRNREWKRL